LTLFWRPSGCVLWFDFAEKSGNTVYDLSGNGNNGTVYGAQRINGHLIGGLSFDGVDDYIKAPNVVTSKPITLSFLVKLNTIAKSNIFDSRDSAFSSGGKGIAIEDSGSKGKYSVGIGDGTNFVWLSNVIDLTDLNLHLINVIFTSTAMRIYADGSLIATGDVSSIADSPLNVATTMQIAHGLGGYFSGSIAFFRVYSRALNKEEIAYMYRYISSQAKQTIPSKFVPRGLRL